MSFTGILPLPSLFMCSLYCSLARPFKAGDVVSNHDSRRSVDDWGCKEWRRLNIDNWILEHCASDRNQIFLSRISDQLVKIEGFTHSSDEGKNAHRHESVESGRSCEWGGAMPVQLCWIPKRVLILFSNSLIINFSVSWIRDKIWLIHSHEYFDAHMFPCSCFSRRCRI